MQLPLGIPRARLALILGALAMLGPFSIDTVFPAFGQMAADFDVPMLALQQTISVYLLGYASMCLLHGPLSDALGRRPIILVGLLVFLLSSIGAALSGSLTELLVYRALQGVSAGVGLIVGRAVIRDVLQGDDAQRLMSQVSMIFGVAPALAPIVGGWLLGWGDWHGIFWFLAGLAALFLVMVWWGLPESHPREHRLPLKTGVLADVYRRILSSSRFRWLALAGTFNFGALFLYIASAPAFVMTHLGLSETQFGWFFVPMIGGMVLGSFASGRSAGRISTYRLAKIGFACCVGASLCNIAVQGVGSSGVLLSVAPLVLLSFGVALVFPVLTLAILDLFPNERGSASAMQAFIGLTSNALIAGLWSPLVSHSLLWMAVAGSVFTLLALCCWRMGVDENDKAPLMPRDVAALEPTDEM